MGGGSMSSLWVRRVPTQPCAAGVEVGLAVVGHYSSERPKWEECFRGNEWHFKAGRKGGKKQSSQSWPRLVAPPVTSHGRGQKESQGSPAEKSWGS